MPYRIKINKPGLPKGGTVEIAGIGVVENGKWFAVSDEAHDMFRHMHGHQESVTDEGGGMRVTNELGPTLIEAFKGDSTVAVEKVQSTHATKPETEVPAGGPAPVAKGETVEADKNEGSES